MYNLRTPVDVHSQGQRSLLSCPCKKAEGIQVRLGAANSTGKCGVATMMSMLECFQQSLQLFRYAGVL